MRKNFGHFVEENPDIILPSEVDVQVSLESDPLKESKFLLSQTTLKVLLKNLIPHCGHR
jgi:hypothetical protein